MSDEATQTDVTGAFRLPRSFLCALYFPVHAGLNVEVTKFYLGRVAVFPGGYAVSLRYDDGTTAQPVVATAVIAKSSHVEFKAYSLPGVDDFADSTGKLVIGKTDDIDRMPAGVYDFSPAGGLLDIDCIRPIGRGIASFRIANGSDTSPPIYGDVRFVAGANVKLSVDYDYTHQATAIRIDAVKGDGLTDDCECTGDSDLPPPIRTIDGVPPDAQGNFTLVGNSCIGITPMANGLSLADTCSKPCCGCPELTALEQELTHMGTEGASLRDFSNRLKAQNDAMNAIVLGSRMSDGPCTSC